VLERSIWLVTRSIRCPGPDEFSAEATAYSLDPESPPREFTTDPDAIDRQREEIEAIHDLGGEVQLTAHTRTHLSPDRALEIATAFEAAGRRYGQDRRRRYELGRPARDARSDGPAEPRIEIPFVMMSHGEHGVLGRYMAPFLGSMLCFTQHEYPPGGFYLQPLTENVRAVFDSVRNVTPTREPERQNWL